MKYHIPLIDLAGQYRSIQREIDRAVKTVLASGQYILGQYLQAFERALAERCDCDMAVGVNSGTDALELALRACGVGRGDEVIVPALTFMATPLAVTTIGGIPVIADVREDDFGIDLEDAARRVTSRTRAIIPVHLFGQPCDLDGVLALAKAHKLAVIEDCAQAIGARYRGRPVGSFGQAGCFSFYPTKNLGAVGDGGAIVTSDPGVAERLGLLRNYGTKDKMTYSGYGRNSRLDELQAAILLVKLKYLQPWNAARRERAGWYRDSFAAEGLERVGLPAELPGREHVYHLFSVRVPERDRMLADLRARGIQAMTHYPRPIHLGSMYEGQPLKRGDLPAAERIADEILALPLHPQLTREQVAEVVEQTGELLEIYGLAPSRDVRLKRKQASRA
ncbi:MAG TPA: DegT/DnrJ/EryC1/StrS family aminotransferase [bacterium]